MEMLATIAAPPLLKGKTEIIERGLIGIKTRAIRPKYAYELWREIQDLAKLTFALPDLLLRLLTFLLRLFALGDVNHGTHEFDQIAGWAENGMAHHVDVSDRAAGMNDSVIQLELRLLKPRCLGCLPNFGLIIRMDALKECFESRFSTVRVKT